MSKLVDSATALHPLLREQASSIEDCRRIEPVVLSTLHEMGAFNLQLSDEHGGQAADPITYLRVLEELARGDGASGWCAMVGSESSGCVNAFLKPEIVRKILVESAQSAVALTVVGAGKAVRTHDGFRVSGRWRFASGCRHSTWLGALCVIYDGDDAQSRENGSPLTRLIFTPASNAILHDTWHTSGLRGTASDDFELENVDVKADFTFDLIDTPIDSSKSWRIPLGVRLAMSKAASVCGMARGAMDALFPLLERKPFAGARPMREEARAQVMLAQAEAALEGGRAYLYQTVEWAWELVQQDHQLNVEEVAKVRLAIASSAQRALEALHLMQELAGTSAVLDPIFDRYARDLEVARHHMQLQTHIFEDVGRVLLGLSPRNPMF